MAQYSKLCLESSHTSGHSTERTFGHGRFKPMRRFSLLVLLAGLLAASCGPPAPPRAADRQFELTGQVLALRPEHGEVLIRHEDIPNFMPGMTMPFRVQDPALLAPLAAGDLVTATLVVGDRSYLTAITKTGSAPMPDEAVGFPPGAGVHILEPGDEAPPTTLTDQDGQAVSLADWRGQAVAVTFIFTRCPLPEFCPLMDRRFLEVQRAAASDAALQDRVRLLSVSFDPDYDTPDVLKAHAARLGANEARWRFATAPAEVVDRFAAEFGVNVIRVADGDITHSLRTAVIGPDGRMTAVYSGNEWTAAQLVADLRGALASAPR